VSRQINRLAAGHAKDPARIDRSTPLSFSFDGKMLGGFQGDTLASALLANDIHLMGRSFKYHRPRGPIGLGSEEPNALIQLARGNRTEPNTRATQIELFDGLTAETQNRWPSVRFDVGAVNQLFHKLFPAGFYYKTFMWPASFWMTYEHVIRMAAGLGKAAEGPDPDRYERMHVHCDVLVAGGGAAGLAAALAAGRTGARVILVDESNELGGSLLSEEDVAIDGRPALEWIAEVTAELRSMPEVTILTRSTVAGYYDHNYLTIAERVTDHIGAVIPNVPRQRMWKVRTTRVVLATGTIERPLVFRDNDRPGIMLSSAVRGYAVRYGVLAGRRPLIVTNGDDGYRTALAMQTRGAQVVAIVDLRGNPDGPLVEAVRAHGIPIHANHSLVGSVGGLRVQGAEIAAMEPDGQALTGTVRKVECDLIAMSGGFNPTVHLFSQSRGKLRWDAERSIFLPNIRHEPQASVGGCNGDFSVAQAIRDGFAQGLAMAEEAGFTGAAPDAPTVEEPGATPERTLWLLPSTKPVGHKGKHFVDFQNDVTAADLKLATREGYRSIEHVKRYTTTGMATDQGKTSNVNALAIVSETLGVDVTKVGTTTFRPPYTPTTIGAYAGRDHGALFDPVRTTAMDGWHRENGATFEHVGQWMRAWYYPRKGETMRQAVDRECVAARTGVGILDASTLGKIDVHGPDAAEFLNRIYTNAWMKLGVGRCRYGLMLKDDGFVMDDGVTTRIAEDRFHMTTTTGGAAGVLSWMEEHLQTEWPELKVRLTSVTEQWAVATIGGPKSRELLAKLTDLDLSVEAFPFMSMKEGTVAGLPVRVFRISFTGELSFEINVPRRYGRALWEALMAAGAPFDITPYGTEAMHVLRAERGFIIVGQDTDGSVTPVDLGMDWIVSKAKPDFIGKRGLARPDLLSEDRKQLVGLLTEDPKEVLPEGGQIVEHVKAKPPMDMLGHVTSSYYSPNAGRSIAMALVKGGHKRHGETLFVPLSGRTVKVTVGEPVFFDKEGSRKDG
jgi:sarcosine oxidase subunit alpha